MDSACDICGCSQKNLVDGFYYCTECGTQDTNVRETLVDLVSLGDGLIGMGNRKKIKQIPQANQEQMTDNWYRWHTLNFVLNGVANDMVELGAAPTFKTKLLWIWTRYMKKYLNKADFGLSPDENDIDNETIVEEEQDDNEAMNKHFLDFDEDDDDDENEQIQSKYAIQKLSIEKISMRLVVSMIYAALNLDKSHIQLADIIRFIKEERLPLNHWQKYVPPEMKPKKLHFCLLFNRYVNHCSISTIKVLSMQLFQKLELGNPIVPDLRLIVDKYLQELCLPDDIKPLVLSLMFYRSFDYLDVNVALYAGGRFPPYEVYVMAHILCAMKICFGIDDQYENTLSDATDKINEMENHPRSYNSEPTNRLFSFREWRTYILFRKSMLWSHSLYLGAPHYSDMDDYVTFEHLNDKPDFKKTLKDEIARDILAKMPEVTPNVIPRSEFPATTAPHTTYTQVIMRHQQDPEVKQILSEDFTKYSLKYITKDMFLVDPDDENPKNIIVGVNSKHLKETDSSHEFHSYKRVRLEKGMVYVKDCDNHNWMVTQRPKFEHIEKTKKNDDIDENSNDSGASSADENSLNKNASSADENSLNKNETLSDLSSVTSINANDNNNYEFDSKETIEDSKVFNDLNTIIEIEIDKNNVDHSDIFNIPQEDENVNIFDDDFKDLDVKKEEGKDVVEDAELETDEPMTEAGADTFHNYPDILRHNPNTTMYRTRRDSDVSSVDSVLFNPESMDRNKVIKELVIHACDKYRVSLPGKYVIMTKKKYVRKKYAPGVERARVLGLTKQKLEGMIEQYHNKVQNDILVQMSSMVQSAIADFNATKDDVHQQDTPMEVEELPIVDNDTNNETVDDQNANIENEQTLDDTTDIIDEPYKLFDDESDGETHAEELLPKKNPEFDEATHDISQLYVKSEEADVLEMSLNPNLFKIVDMEIGDKKEPEEQKPVSSDSEDGMSLNLIQELNAMHQQIIKQMNYKTKMFMRPLIGCQIPSYNYWTKHYMSEHDKTWSSQRFMTEVDETFPSSFRIVLDECADVCGYPAFNVYTGLQQVEKCIIVKCMTKKRFMPSFFESEMKRFKKNKN